MAKQQSRDGNLLSSHRSIGHYLLKTSQDFNLMRRNAKLGLASVKKTKKLLKKTEGPFIVYYQQQEDGSYAKVCARKSPSPETSPMLSSRSNDPGILPIKANELLSRYQTHVKLLNDDAIQRFAEQPTPRQLVCLTPSQIGSTTPMHFGFPSPRFATCTTPKIQESPKRRLLKRSLSQNHNSHRAKTSQVRLSLDYLSSQCLSIKDSVKTSTSNLSNYKNELNEALKQLTKKIETPQPNPYRENLHTAYTSKANLFKCKTRRRRPRP